MDFSLPDELVALRDAAARFAAGEIEPHARDWDRAARFDDAMIGKLGAQGFMGIMIPERFGGAGGDHMMFAIILEELARHDGGLALAVEGHNGLCCQHIMVAGNDEQKAKFLPPLARGEQIGSWCLTEPGSGTDAAGMRTMAVRNGDDWVINGSKQFITNGDRAGTFVVMALGAPAGGRRVIHAFVVERDTPGLLTGQPEEKLGMRSSDTVTVTLDDVRVPEANRLGAPGQAFDDVRIVLQGGRVMISAISLGLARAALEDSVKYAHERTTFGKAIINYQMIQSKIADMACQIEASRLMLYRNATALDAGDSPGHLTAVTKVFSSEMATRACLEAIQILGGYGYLREYNVERYLRDAKLCEIGEGTSEILRVLIARAVSKQLGFEAERPAS